MASFIFIENNRIKVPSATKVIKAKSYTRVVSIDKILSKAQSKAEEMISKAKKQAEEIIKDAKAVYASEKQKGYREGLEKAKHEMTVEMSTTSLKTVQYYHSIEKKVVALVMDTVRKVIDGTDKRELIIGLVKKALLIFKSQKMIKLKVAQVHVDLLNEYLSEVMTGYPYIDTVEIKGDERISPNELIMESEIGIVNAGIDIQLAAIEEAFAKCFPQKKSY
jgi:type III secretion protein L